MLVLTIVSFLKNKPKRIFHIILLFVQLPSQPFNRITVCVTFRRESGEVFNFKSAPIANFRKAFHCNFYMSLLLSLFFFSHFSFFFYWRYLVWTRALCLCKPTHCTIASLSMISIPPRNNAWLCDYIRDKDVKQKKCLVLLWLAIQTLCTLQKSSVLNLKTMPIICWTWRLDYSSSLTTTSHSLFTGTD